MLVMKRVKRKNLGVLDFLFRFLEDDAQLVLRKAKKFG